MSTVVRTLRRAARVRLAAALAAATLLLTLIAPAAASAHSLQSSTIVVRATDDDVAATITIATQTATKAADSSDPQAIAAYLAEHFAVSGGSGSAWAESVGDVREETVDGIASVSVDVELDPGGDDASAFTIDFDGIIEADAAHEAVVVLRDADGNYSTPGVLTADDDTLSVGDGHALGAGDMLRHGFTHVLAGADHLLFLVALLLPAPLIAASGRWTPGTGRLRQPLQRVVHVVTAFTVGHSITLIAAALGWVAVPSAPVEVLIAASVGVAAVHAIRPLAGRGEATIALLFGLVHGLAFAGILEGLGLSGTPSVVALLAFNVGIELAGLLTIAVTLPSLLVLSRTPAYASVRIAGALFALAAAAGWAAERTAGLTNPLAGIEAAVVAHPWTVPVALAALAAAAAISASAARHGNRGPRRPRPELADELAQPAE